MRLEEFLRPLYQDLDGASRFDSVERVRRIAQSLHSPIRELELLILFSGLAKWLQKPRNVSRTLLTGTVSEIELATTIRSLARLDDPQSDVERAVAAAMMIDSAGVRGLAERLTHARREGLSIEDVAREEPPEIPAWMPAEGREMLLVRRDERQKVCDALLREMAG